MGASNIINSVASNFSSSKSNEFECFQNFKNFDYFGNFRIECSPLHLLIQFNLSILQPLKLQQQLIPKHQKVLYFFLLTLSEAKVDGQPSYLWPLHSPTAIS